MIETYSIDKCPRKFTASDNCYTGYGHVVTWKRTYPNGYVSKCQFLAFTHEQLLDIKRSNDALLAEYGEWESLEFVDGEWRIYYGSLEHRNLDDWEERAWPTRIGDMTVYCLMSDWGFTW